MAGHLPPPTFPALNPAYIDEIRALRDDIHTALAGIDDDSHSLDEARRALSSVFTPKRIQRLRRFERTQTEEIIITIQDEKPVTFPSRRSLSSYERVMSHYSRMLLGAVETGLPLASAASGLHPPDLSQVTAEYQLVAGAVDPRGMASAISKYGLEAKRIAPFIYEDIVDLRSGYTLEEVVANMADVMITEKRVAANQERYTRALSTNEGVILNSSRHRFVIDGEPVRAPQSHKRKKRKIRFNRYEPAGPMEGPLYIDMRLKRAGNEIGESLVRKYVRHLFEGKDISDMLAMRQIGTRSINPYVVADFLHSIEPNPAFWHGRIHSHGYRTPEHALNDLLGDLPSAYQNASGPERIRLKTLAAFMNQATRGKSGEVALVTERAAEKNGPYTSPAKNEVFLPATGRLADGHDFNLVISFDIFTHENFFAYEQAKGLTHQEYRAGQYCDQMRASSAAEMAMYYYLAGLGNGPGLMEKLQLPLAQLIYDTAAARLASK